MNKNKIMIWGAALLMMLISSCRSESDKLMTYDHADPMAFKKADNSFAEKFKILWNGLNQNYAWWDYEEECGLDWDAVYDEYLPQFEALDEQETVTDDELKALIAKVCSPLHDGHMAVIFENHKTGTKEVLYQPSVDRIKNRDDYVIANTYTPSLTYYSQVANGEVEVDGEGNPIVKECYSKTLSILKRVLRAPGVGADWIKTQIAELSSLPAPTSAQTAKLDSLKSLKNELEACLVDQVTQTTIDQYNELTLKYESLQVPGLDYIDPQFNTFGIDVKFALLKGNIAYLYISDFHLSVFLNPELGSNLFNTNISSTKRLIEEVSDTWEEWFNTVQQLHKAGSLGGVIIDVRGNGGGIQNDNSFVAGSMLPAGGAIYGYSRYKRGTGRYDYSQLSPSSLETMAAEHDVITEPVVVMTNCMSLSMSEMTTLIVKGMENGTHIGKRSRGGICGLRMDNTQFTKDYVGHVGERGKTPVYVYLPLMATLTLDMKMVEGEGITPDIEVDLDEAKFKATGQDTQLDRALQFLRTGN